MKIASVSVRDVRGLDSVDEAVRRLEEAWQQGSADLRRFWSDLGPDRSASDLTLLLKADLRCRFQRGERPKAADYLALFSELRALPERMLSLIYEEYCLLEDQGERPDIEQFCERYEPWKDSLLSQLRYHSMFSQVVGAPSTPRFPELGDKFQEFALREELGRGGSARVYLANDELLGGRPVALKIYLDRGSEASIQGRLEHPHIVPVHSTPYQAETKLRGLCMPYRPGVPLDEVIRRVEPASKPRRSAALWRALTERPESKSKSKSTSTSMETEDPVSPAGPDRPQGPGWQSFPIRGRYADAAAWIVLRIAQALAHAHSRDVQHRDVKPANILLAFEEGPQLFDFNLAFDPNSPGQAEAALRGGTLPYMAPEQLQAFIDPARWEGVDPRADLYSLGFVLRELLTGEAPEIPAQNLKPGQAIRELLERRQGFRPNLRTVNPRIPQALEAITARCLAYDPADRYASANDLAEDLQRFLARRPLRHAENPDRTERISNWAWRNRRLLAVSLVGMLSFVAYNYDDWANTVEGRKPFVNAVAALDNGHPSDALPVLEKLADANPQSPVILFYKAVGQAEVGQQANVVWQLGHVWDVPRAGETLLAWSHKHPELAVHINSLVIPLRESLVIEGKTLDAQEVERLYNTVYESLNLIVRLDPMNTRARIGLATVLLDQNRHEASDRILGDLIQEFDVRSSIQDRDYLRMAFHTRARLRTKWAQALADPPTSGQAEFVQAEKLLILAGKDLDHAWELISPSNSEARFEVTFVRCEALLQLGKTADKQGRHEDAVSKFGDATRLAKSLRSTIKGEAYANDLQTRIHALRRAAQMPKVRPAQPERPAGN